MVVNACTQLENPQGCLLVSKELFEVMVCPFMFNVGDPPGFLLHIHSCWFISLADELPFTSVQSIFQFDDHDFDDV